MTERSKHELRRSTRLSQIFSAKTPSRKNTTPKNLNKRKQLKPKTQSNSRQKKLIKVDVLLLNNICTPGLNPKTTLTRKSTKGKVSSCNESISERRMSLRSFEKFCGFESPKRNSRKISENAPNLTKSNRERSTLKESVASARKNKIVTMSEGKSKGIVRRSRRWSLVSSAKTPTKKSTTPQNVNKKKQLAAKTQSNRRQKKSVEVDVLLGSGICPSGLKPKTRKSEKRKFPSCSESFSERRTSLRSGKKFCLELELETPKKDTPENTPNLTKSNKKIGSKTKRKPKSNEHVETSISSILCDSAINSFSMNKSNSMDSIPLDDLLFVTSSRKKKPRDITQSSGICSAHSSFMSSVATSSRKVKSDDLLFISPASVNKKNGLFKIPETKRPGKKTLKHKRLVLNELNVRNSGHEDDLLENIKLTPLKNVFDLDNESDASWNIATPKCGFKLSPFLPKRTPVFKDCFSPTELQISRKNAEEYMHRNNKRKTLPYSPQELPQRKELTKKIDALEILKTLSQKQKNIERSLRDEFSDEEKDDDYYSEEEELILNNAVTF